MPNDKLVRAINSKGEWWAGNGKWSTQENKAINFSNEQAARWDIESHTIEYTLVRLQPDGGWS